MRLRNGWWGLCLSASIVGASFAQEREGPNRAPEGDKSRGEEEQIRKREEWFVQSRGLQQVKRPDLLRAQAVEELETAQRARESELELAGETWSSLGPVGMTMLNWTMGRVSGRVSESGIGVHPTDENTIYLGSASGGVWKTVNGGTSWTPIFDATGTLTVGSVAVDPANPTTVWVGTGEHGNSCTGYMGMGAFRSTDAGATFQARNGGGTLQLSYIQSIALHPTDGQTVLVSGEGVCDSATKLAGGVFRSTNGGGSWTKVLTGSGGDVLFDPGNPSLAYAALGGSIYRSTNGGSSWTSTTSPGGRLRLAMAPSNTQTLYALGSGGGLYRTTNGASSWTTMNSSACEGQCTYNLSLDVHPTDPNRIIVGSIRFASSTNGGSTLTYLTTTWGSSQKVHQDTQCLRYSRTNGNRFWVGSDGGLWRTDNAGSTFTNLNAGLTLTQFYDVAIHPDDPTRVWGGAQDNSSEGRFGSQQWDVTVVTGDGFQNLVDPGNTTRVFQTSYPSNSLPSVYKSSSSGAVSTFSKMSTTGISGGGFPWVTPLAVVPGNLFVGGFDIFRAATSSSGSWTKISTTGSSSSLSVISTTPGSNVGYAGSAGGAVYRTANVLGTGWSNVTGNYPGGVVSDIAADRADTNRVFVTRGGFGASRLYRSTVGGTTWSAVGAGLPNVPANAVAIDPLAGNRIFVGTDVGVYESTDGGNNFAPFSLGLPLGLVVTDLEVDDSPHVLVAGTYGRGAWRVNLTGAQNQPPSAAFAHAANQLTVTFTDQSTDPDGTIASRLWSFGDGTTSTATNPVKTYAAAGTYTVSLTVTDDGGASDDAIASVTVTSTGCQGTIYNGTITTSGSTQIQPNGTWYQSTVAGTHRGCLNGPSGTDFDLYLDRWNGSAWVQVAASDGSTSVESITYQGTAGYYRWRVVSFSGTGSYTFQLQRP
jgi:hypothetical protein